MKNKEVISEGKLHEVKYDISKRANGSTRIQQNFEFCPTMTEQHSAHLTDLNILMKKFQPDELVAYIAAKSAHRQEIVGHDFSQEPNLQDAKQIAYNLKSSFLNLSEDIQKEFNYNHVAFLKFIDNPANQEKMLKLGLMTKKEIAANATPPATTTTQEAKAASESTSAKSSTP